MRTLVFAVALLCASPAYALTCQEVREAVAQHGEWAVTYWARSNGYSDAQIAEIKRRCLK